MKNIKKEIELLKKIEDTSLSEKEREKAMVKLSVLMAKRDRESNRPLNIILLIMILSGLFYFLNN